MQALIATSRSISQDVFLERENKRKYDQHVSKVQSIKHLKQFPAIQHVREVQKMTKTLYKHKQSAKTFREHEETIQRKRQNRLLLEKIWKINSTLKTDSTVMHLQHQSGSNWMLKKRQAQLIKQENKRLAINIISNGKIDTKQYKKKLQNQIKQYLELRNNIRKFNTQKSKKRLQRVQSQKKGFNIKLKLKDEQDAENHENEKQKKKQSESKNKNGNKIPAEKINLIKDKDKKEDKKESKKDGENGKQQDKVGEEIQN